MALTRSLEGARKRHTVDIGILAIHIYDIHYPLSAAHVCLQTHKNTLCTHERMAIYVGDDQG